MSLFTRRSGDTMVIYDISKLISSYKNVVFLFKFLWNVFPMAHSLWIQHWFKEWRDVE